MKKTSKGNSRQTERTNATATPPKFHIGPQVEIQASEQIPPIAPPPANMHVVPKIIITPPPLTWKTDYSIGHFSEDLSSLLYSTKPETKKSALKNIQQKLSSISPLLTNEQITLLQSLDIENIPTISKKQLVALHEVRFDLSLKFDQKAVEQYEKNFKELVSYEKTVVDEETNEKKKVPFFNGTQIANLEEKKTQLLGAYETAWDIAQSFDKKARSTNNKKLSGLSKSLSDHLNSTVGRNLNLFDKDQFEKQGGEAQTICDSKLAAHEKAIRNIKVGTDVLGYAERHPEALEKYSPELLIAAFQDYADTASRTNTTKQISDEDVGKVLTYLQERENVRSFSKPLRKNFGRENKPHNIKLQKVARKTQEKLDGLYDNARELKELKSTAEKQLEILKDSTDPVVKNMMQRYREEVVRSGSEVQTNIRSLRKLKKSLKKQETLSEKKRKKYQKDGYKYIETIFYDYRSSDQTQTKSEKKAFDQFLNNPKKYYRIEEIAEELSTPKSLGNETQKLEQDRKLIEELVQLKAQEYLDFQSIVSKFNVKFKDQQQKATLGEDGKITFSSTEPSLAQEQEQPKVQRRGGIQNSSTMLEDKHPSLTRPRRNATTSTHTIPPSLELEIQTALKSHELKLEVTPEQATMLAECYQAKGNQEHKTATEWINQKIDDTAFQLRFNALKADLDPPTLTAENLVTAIQTEYSEAVTTWKQNPAPQTETILEDDKKTVRFKDNAEFVPKKYSREEVLEKLRSTIQELDLNIKINEEQIKLLAKRYDARDKDDLSISSPKQWLKAEIEATQVDHNLLSTQKPTKPLTTAKILRKIMYTKPANTPKSPIQETSIVFNQSPKPIQETTIVFREQPETQIVISTPENQPKYNELVAKLNAHNENIQTQGSDSKASYQEAVAKFDELDKQTLEQTVTKGTATINIPHENDTPKLDPLAMKCTGAKGFTITRHAQETKGVNTSEVPPIVARYTANPDGTVKCATIALPDAEGVKLKLVDEHGKDIEIQNIDGKSQQVWIEEHLKKSPERNARIVAEKNGKTYDLCSAEEFAQAKGIEMGIDNAIVIATGAALEVKQQHITDIEGGIVVSNKDISRLRHMSVTARQFETDFQFVSREDSSAPLRIYSLTPKGEEMLKQIQEERKKAVESLGSTRKSEKTLMIEYPTTPTLTTNTAENIRNAFSSPNASKVTPQQPALPLEALARTTEALQAFKVLSNSAKTSPEFPPLIGDLLKDWAKSNSEDHLKEIEKRVREAKGEEFIVTISIPPTNGIGSHQSHEKTYDLKKIFGTSENSEGRKKLQEDVKKAKSITTQKFTQQASERYFL
jgi:hypothetical protein